MLTITYIKSTKINKTLYISLILCYDNNLMQLMIYPTRTESLTGTEDKTSHKPDSNPNPIP